MVADYDFYKNSYKGIVIADANSYGYFGERASDELALYSNYKIFSEDATAQSQLKRCACRIAEILFSSVNGSTNGKNIASESVAGYYSASYTNLTDSQVRGQINTAIKLYVGRYIIGAKKVMW